MSHSLSLFLQAPATNDINLLSSTAAKADIGSSSSDLLLAQELARRERERLKHEEQRHFEQLRAQYGMDNDGGSYREQTMANMQKAVYKGQMTVTDYYDRQVLLARGYYFNLSESKAPIFFENIEAPIFPTIFEGGCYLSK